MVEKRAKHRIQKNENTTKETAEKRPSPNLQMSMVGIRLSDTAKSAKSKRKFPACSFLPAELGRKHLVQSPGTASRQELLVRAKKLGEAVQSISPEQVYGKLPAINKDGSTPKSGEFYKKRVLNENFLVIKGGKDMRSTGEEELPLKLPKLRRNTPREFVRQPQTFQSSAHYSTSNDGKANFRHEILNGLGNNEALPKLPELIIKQNNYVGRNEKFVSKEEKQCNLKQRMHVFLPSLSQNCEMSKNGSAIDGAQCTIGSEPRCRRGTKKLNCGQKSANERPIGNPFNKSAGNCGI